MTWQHIQLKTDDKRNRRSPFPQRPWWKRGSSLGQSQNHIKSISLLSAASRRTANVTSFVIQQAYKSNKAVCGWGIEVDARTITAASNCSISISVHCWRVSLHGSGEALTQSIWKWTAREVGFWYIQSLSPECSNDGTTWSIILAKELASQKNRGLIAVSGLYYLTMVLTGIKWWVGTRMRHFSTRKSSGIKSFQFRPSHGFIKGISWSYVSLFSLIQFHGCFLCKKVGDIACRRLSPRLFAILSTIAIMAKGIRNSLMSSASLPRVIRSTFYPEEWRVTWKLSSSTNRMHTLNREQKRTLICLK